MTRADFSVVIVSYQRPQLLCRCVRAVLQQLDTPFEIVVVASPDGIAALKSADLERACRCHAFSERNISQARNIGISMAAAPLVAFIDDDAVPEPMWLYHLGQAFLTLNADAAGGVVRGPDGVSILAAAQSCDETGLNQRLEHTITTLQIPTLPSGHALRTEGTNMAFRREVLQQLGGFDPAFRYHLDDTDLNMRVARAGLRTAFAPLAEVHHGLASGPYRHGSRAPTDLFEIGASWSRFWHKFAPKTHITELRSRIRAQQRRRLLRHMLRGTLDPMAVRPLLARLDAGFDEGTHRTTPQITIPDPPASTHRHINRNQKISILRANMLNIAQKRREARDLLLDNQQVSLFFKGIAARRHRVTYNKGYWEHSVAVAGRRPVNGVFYDHPQTDWPEDEIERIAAQRGLTSERTS